MPEFIIRAEETDLFFLFKDYKELIRCKDCKWNTEHYDDNSCVTYWVCNNWGCHTDLDDYCDEAERK